MSGTFSSSSSAARPARASENTNYQAVLMGSNFSHVMFQATIDHIQFGFRYVDDAILLSDDQMALNNLSLLHIDFAKAFNAVQEPSHMVKHAHAHQAPPNMDELD